MASSSKLPNSIITRRLFSVAKHEMAGDATAARNLNIPLHYASDRVDISKWRKVNSAAFGIERSIIPLPSRIVLRVLRDKGHQCFLVGGCVRDLLLKRVPKDFDVITTANLKQIKNHFHHSHIVGRRFPVCVVHIRGHDIEVSSFDTVANSGFAERENSVPRLMPRSCHETDKLLWRNSMQRDFIVKRILCGLRIAARLSLSISHDTATAIYSLSSSVLTLSKSRIMMELNYMLSYGAAQASLSLLERFNLLKVFFPLHAAILDHQTNEGCSLSSTMLMVGLNSIKSSHVVTSHIEMWHRELSINNIQRLIGFSTKKKEIISNRDNMVACVQFNTTVNRNYSPTWIIWLHVVDLVILVYGFRCRHFTKP